MTIYVKPSIPLEINVMNPANRISSGQWVDDSLDSPNSGLEKRPFIDAIVRFYHLTLPLSERRFCTSKFCDILLLNFHGNLYFSIIKLCEMDEQHWNQNNRHEATIQTKDFPTQWSPLTYGIDR